MNLSLSTQTAIELVTWDDDGGSGVGRSGTRYDIRRRRMPGGDSVPAWWIAIDDDDFCAVDSVEAAIARVEHIEALRCFLHGFAAELDDAQLRRAEALAAEMGAVADLSLARGDFTAEEREAIEQSASMLRSIHHRIRTTRETRGRSGANCASVH